MLKYMFVLVLAALVFCFSAEIEALDGGRGNIDGLCGVDYVSELSGINNLLEQRESSSDASANLRLARIIYDEVLDKRPKPMRKLNAAKIFLKLASVMKPGFKCTRASYNVLLQNQLATGFSGSKKLEHGQSVRRVDSVLEQVASKHSKECINTHVNNCKAKLHSFNDKDSLDKVDKMFANVGQTSDTNAAYEFIVSLKSEDEYASKYNPVLNAGFVYNTLNELTSNTEDGKFLHPVQNEQNLMIEANRDELANLMKKFMVEPCDRYVSEIKDVIEPLEFDASWYHEVQVGEIEMYKAWTRYLLCKKLKAKETEIVQNLTEYVKKIGQSSLYSFQ